MTIRMQDVMLYGGGECLQKFGVPFWRMNRAQDVAATLTRSGTIGSSVTRDGSILRYSANRLRVEWLDTDADGVFDTPALLLEWANTNDALQSEDFGTTWTASATVTTNVDTAPDGTTTADNLDDTSAVAAQTALQDITIADDLEPCCFSLYVHKTNHSGDIGGLQVLLTGGTGVSGMVHFNPTTGVIADHPTTPPDASGIESVNENWWRVWCVMNNNGTGNTTARITVLPAIAATLGGASDAAQVGDVTVWGAQFERAPVPSSYIPTTTVAVTRNADTLYADFVHPPQAMTVYVKFVERATIALAPSGLFQIGGSADSGARFRVVVATATSVYRIDYTDGTDTAAVAAAATPSTGDTVEIRAVLNADGSVTLGQAINAGAEAVTTSAGSVSIPTAWAGTRFYLNSRSGTTNGINEFVSVKVARGVHTMAELRELFA